MIKNVPLNGKRKIAIVTTDPAPFNRKYYYRIIEDAFGTGEKDSNGWFGWSGTYEQVDTIKERLNTELGAGKYDLLIFNEEGGAYVSYVCKA
jgi:hypothetical protein